MQNANEAAKMSSAIDSCVEQKMQLCILLHAYHSLGTCSADVRAPLPAGNSCIVIVYSATCTHVMLQSQQKTRWLIHSKVLACLARLL